MSCSRSRGNRLDWGLHFPRTIVRHPGWRKSALVGVGVPDMLMRMVDHEAGSSVVKHVRIRERSARGERVSES